MEEIRVSGSFGWDFFQFSLWCKQGSGSHSPVFLGNKKGWTGMS